MPYAHRRESPLALVELVRVFQHQLRHCRLAASERVVAVTDPVFDPHYAAACVGAAQALGADAFEVHISHTKPWSEDTLRGVFGPADLIVYATSHGLHYSEAMREALDQGKRALMVVVPPHVLERRIANPELIERTRAGAKLFDGAKTVTITSGAGTDLTMDVSGRRGVASYGVADEPGHLDFWGAGMFQVAVVEGSMEGRLVLDSGDLIFAFGRHIDRRVTIDFREGRAIRFDGGTEADLIRMHLEAAHDPNAFLAGHISCGTDPTALWTAEIAQFPVAGGGGADAEAFYGNVQVEIGSNDDVMFGGKNRTSVHLGLCCLDSSLKIDGIDVLTEGEFVSESLRV